VFHHEISSSAVRYQLSHILLSYQAFSSGSPKAMISDVVNRILNGDNTVNVADIARIINGN
jgi:hypothetical protein